MKVLVVDTDQRFSSQALRFLESHAHLVVHEDNAARAMHRAEHWRPDLVIVDVELTDGGMLESLSAMKDRPAILLTSHMDRFDLAWKAWQKGGDELLMKPLLRWDDLHLAVVTAMEKAAAGGRVAGRPIAASA